MNISRLTLIGLLIVAAALRCWNFPRATEVRDVDELPYIEGGLNVLEGMMPSNKAAPGGPLVWMTWSWGAAQTAKDFLRGADERATPVKVRPFIALDHAIFDNDRDMNAMHKFVLACFFLISLIGVVAAFRIGKHFAGLEGALLCGGLFAVAPLVVDFTAMTRPYIMAWTFVALAIDFAVNTVGRRRWIGSAIFLGLAVASRIDILAMTPIVLWAFAYRREPGTSLIKQWLLVVIISAAATLIAAPWLVTGVLHMIRMIVTAGLSGAPGVTLPWYRMAWIAAWENGFGITILLAVAGLAMLFVERRILAAALGCFIFLMLLSILKDDGSGIRHKAGGVIAMILVIGVFIEPIARRWPALTRALIALALALPLIQSVRMILDYRKAYAYDGSVDWVEKNVAPGRHLYVMTPMLMTKKPLPTEAAADRLWGEVMSPRSHETKLAAAMTRFNLSSTYYPRAFSEEVLLTERMARRIWFILGGRPATAAPRYDIQLQKSVFMWGVADVPADFRDNGGAVILKGPPDPLLGTPAASFAGKSGVGTYVYVSNPQPNVSPAGR